MNDTNTTPSAELEADTVRQALLDLADDCRSSGEQPATASRVELLEQLLTPAVCQQLSIYTLPQQFLLSVVMPVYNERATVEEIVRRVSRCGIRCEIIIVDDGSTDGTRDILSSWHDREGIRVIFHDVNQGKGAALKTGFVAAKGDVVVIQDGDLEYDPVEYVKLLQPIILGKADVVYGSRFSSNDRPVYPYWHQTANRLITLLSNMFTNRKLSDVETCYKMFRREVIDQIAAGLQEKSFGVELEITAKLARLPDVKIYERPISYCARSYADGKKIGWRDALRAIFCVLRY